MSIIACMWLLASMQHARRNPYSYIPIIICLDGYLSMGTEVSVTKSDRFCMQVSKAG
jgi:hypothetical protein